MAKLHTNTFQSYDTKLHVHVQFLTFHTPSQLAPGIDSYLHQVLIEVKQKKITKDMIEKLIITFYKLEEFDACWEVLQFYKRQYRMEYAGLV